MSNVFNSRNFVSSVQSHSRSEKQHDVTIRGNNEIIGYVSNSFDTVTSDGSYSVPSAREDGNLHASSRLGEFVGHLYLPMLSWRAVERGYLSQGSGEDRDGLERYAGIF
jgi:hypothetical protein